MTKYFFLNLIITITGATKYIPIFSIIKPIPYPNTSSSESILRKFRIESDVSNGVIVNFTASLNVGEKENL